MEDWQPWPEIGRPDDVAGAALFFASDDSNFVTGDAMLVSGGMTAAGPGLFGRGRDVRAGFVAPTAARLAKALFSASGRHGKIPTERSSPEQDRKCPARLK
jgi:hypothetical protein